MALFFAPVANTVLSSVRPDQEGIASGATNAIRELGGVFGDRRARRGVLRARRVREPRRVRLRPAGPRSRWGPAVVALGALAMLFVPRRLRAEQPVATEAERELVAA